MNLHQSKPDINPPNATLRAWRQAGEGRFMEWMRCGRLLATNGSGVAQMVRNATGYLSYICPKCFVVGEKGRFSGIQLLTNPPNPSWGHNRDISRQWNEGAENGKNGHSWGIVSETCQTCRSCQVSIFESLFIRVLPWFQPLSFSGGI